VELDVTKELAARLFWEVTRTHSDTAGDKGCRADQDLPWLRQTYPYAGAGYLLLDITAARIAVKDDRGHRHPVVAALPPTFGAHTPGLKHAGLIGQIDLAD